MHIFHATFKIKVKVFFLGHLTISGQTRTAGLSNQTNFSLSHLQKEVQMSRQHHLDFLKINLFTTNGSRTGIPNESNNSLCHSTILKKIKSFSYHLTGMLAFRIKLNRKFYKPSSSSDFPSPVHN